MVIPMYAAVLGIFFVVLSVRTILVRRKKSVAIGHGEDQELARAIRVHANFSEYVPIALILLLLFETEGASHWLLHGLGMMLLIGRLVHAYGVSQVNENLKFRVTGMMLTFLALLTSALGILYLNI